MTRHNPQLPARPLATVTPIEAARQRRAERAPTTEPADRSHGLTTADLLALLGMDPAYVHALECTGLIARDPDELAAADARLWQLSVCQWRAGTDELAPA